MVVGCSVQDFWHGDPQILWSYKKAREMNNQHQNLLAWLQGSYIKAAVLSALSDKAKYPEQPFPLFGEESKSDREKPQMSQSEIAIRNQVAAAQNALVLMHGEHREIIGEKRI